jgi:hypothetical protein
MSEYALWLTYFNHVARGSPPARRVVDIAQSDRIGSLFDETDSIIELTAGIPHVLSHTNAMPKYLFPINDPIHGEITVGIDWAPTGPERAGLDATYSLASAAR